MQWPHRSVREACRYKPFDNLIRCAVTSWANGKTELRFPAHSQGEFVQTGIKMVAIESRGLLLAFDLNDDVPDDDDAKVVSAFFWVPI